MSTAGRSRSLEHIAQGLVPPAAFAAVPSTPPPTPPPTRSKKKFWKRKKTPSPSPILPALMGVTMTARAIALNLETSNARSLPDRSQDFHNASIQSQSVDKQDLPQRRRGRSRGRALVTKPKQVYGEPNIRAEMHSESRRHHDRSPKGQCDGESRLQMSNIYEFGYEMEERQRQLEEKVQMQNEETREMVRAVMTHQHEDSIQAGRPSDGPRDLEELDEDNQMLMQENSRLIQENTSLVRENKRFEAVSSSLKTKGKKGSPRTQVELLLNENDVLRETVSRLNIELDKYQEKYGNLPTESVSGIRLEANDFELQPKWLTDIEYLSPLFISYDAQLKEKEGIIRMLKNHQDPDTKRRWENLSEQNNLMTEEIQILMQQMEIAKNKALESSESHAKEVGRMSKALAVAQAEAEVSIEALKDLKNELDTLKKHNQKLVAENAEKISAKEHISAVAELKQEMEVAKDTAVKEMAVAFKKIKDIEEERSAITVELTHSKVKVKQLEGQIEAAKQAYDKIQEKCKVLNEELESSDKRNIICESHLAEVLRLVDKATAERDAFAAVIEKEQKISEQAMRRTMLGKWEMGKMEQTIVQYKKQAATHMTDITNQIRTLEENHQGRLLEYNREVAHLRRILQQKQTALDDMTHEKKLIESELENVWQAATSENRRIVDVFTKSKVME